MPETLVDLALAEARRSLDDQATTLRDARTRVTQVVAVSGLASAVVAESAMSEQRGVPALATLALVALAVAAGAGYAVLWPRDVLTPGADAADLLGPAAKPANPSTSARPKHMVPAWATSDRDPRSSRCLRFVPASWQRRQDGCGS
jgi:hypothetical protein